MKEKKTVKQHLKLCRKGANKSETCMKIFFSEEYGVCSRSGVLDSNVTETQVQFERVKAQHNSWNDAGNELPKETLGHRRIL